ncbi:MAG: 50S ribosomal protein L2 [Planctomycetota bacterium]
MAIRVYKPTSAGRRNAAVNLYSELSEKGRRPEKSLTTPLPKKGGRNNQGFITVRGRGGGHKRLYRKIDFRRADRVGIKGEVVAIEYDPNRSSNIALVTYEDGIKRYIIAPKGLKAGDPVITTDEPVDPRPGVCMKLRDIPTGLDVHCVEMRPGKGGQLCRSAGMSARLTNKEDKFATLVMPSGEIRRVHLECRAVIGVVGNADHQQRRLGKAGRSRHLGRRPKTRGVAMSHDAHPLGGGEGRSKGNRAPVSRSGVFSKGGPTRNRKKQGAKLIIRRRKSKRYGQLR